MTDQQCPEREQCLTVEELCSDKDEHNRQGHGDDDFGIDDRNLVDVFDKGAETFLAVVDADGTKCTDDSGKKGGDDGDDECVF